MTTKYICDFCKKEYDKTKVWRTRSSPDSDRHICIDCMIVRIRDMADGLGYLDLRNKPPEVVFAVHNELAECYVRLNTTLEEAKKIKRTIGR